MAVRVVTRNNVIDEELDGDVHTTIRRVSANLDTKMKRPIRLQSKLPAGNGYEGIKQSSGPEPQFNNRRLIGRASDRRNKMIAFGYYGGKFSHLDFLLPLLPTTITHFCEPFGGSAAILINRPPAPVETYNDLDSEVGNFFTCLRDSSDELIRLTSLTPFSREELVKACRPEPRLSDIARW